MPQYDGEVRVEITGDSTKIKKELKETKDDIQSTTQSVSDMFSALNYGKEKDTVFKDIAENAEKAGTAVSETTGEVDNLGDAIEDAGQKTVTFGDLLKANLLSDYIQKGIGKLTDGFTDFIKQGVSLASDLQEVQNVVDTTFGDGAEQIYQWADAAAESFGMSSLQAQNFNGTLGAMLKSMGLTDDAVLKMSTDMVGLAGDMASFYNLDVDLAFEKIRAGISGETEPLKQLGINMSVANLEAYALSQGIETAYDKMSQSEQAILRYNYLMSVTADAQGDFAKTSDSFANQQRILQLQAENLSASLGEKLLPSLNKVFQTANDKLPKLENTAENIGELIGNITEFVLDNHEAILGLIAAYGTFSGVKKVGTFVSDLVGAFKKLTPATEAATAAQEANNAATAVNPYVLIASAIAAVTVGLISLASAAGEASEKLKETAEENVRAYEEQTEKVSGLEDELKEVNDKITEIQSKGKLNFTDEEELLRLQAQKAELSEQLEIEKAILETRRQQAEVSVYDLVSGNGKGSVSNIKSQFADYDEAMKNVENAQDTLDETLKSGNEAAIRRDQETLNYWKTTALEAKKSILEETRSLNELSENLDTSKEKGAEAAAAIAELNKEVYEKFGIPLENTVNEKIEEGETYADYMQRIGKEQLEEDKRLRAEDLADYENNLKAKADELDKSLTRRKISEDEYYQQLGEYLAQNRNLESDEYYKQLDKYNNYLDKKQDAADRAAEQQLKAEKYAAEKLQQEAETAAKKAQQDAEKLLSEQEKTVEKSLTNILKHFQEAYNELEKKRENYKKKLLSIGGDIFSVEEIEKPDGTKVKQYTVNNINEQIKAMRQYNADITKLKKQGASSALLEELTSLGDGDSQQFAKYLSGMSAEEFKKINEAYAEKQRVADELSKELYADEYAAVADGVNAALDAVSEGAADKGKAAADAYAEAFKAGLLKHSEELYPLLGDEKYIKWFGTSGDTPNIFAGMSGDMGRLMKLFMGSNFADIAAKVTSTVRSEQARYSAPAYTASVANTAPDTASETDGKRKSDIAAILEKLNKPLPIMLDGKKIAEVVMTYQNNYMRKTGG